jgi:DNA modification methylase
MPLTIKDVISELPKIKNNSIDLMIIDPPYKKDFPKYFYDFKSKLKLNGQILWFCQPIELYDLPEKPLQILIWKEPYSPKPIRKKYREFFDIIAWYAYGEYTFNKLLWNLMNSIFEDVVIGNERLHKWQKPKTLIERLILTHSNEGDLILDPFAGSGIIKQVAGELKREYMGYEIERRGNNANY